MKIVDVFPPSRSYQVQIENGALDTAGEWAAGLVSGRSAAVVSDTNVWPLYGGRLTERLESAGFSVLPLVFPAGEGAKSLATLTPFYSELARAGFTRDDIVLALGGGVSGDMAGLLAGTYQRGMPFAQIPTTLLACVDSSVGGKTAVDLPEGKNLVGVFHQPWGVLVDPLLLDTLPPEVWADGLGEAIKTALLADADFCAAFRAHEDIPRADMIARCITIKRDIVAQDERDAGGVRNLLNLGHTLGHAWEKLDGYRSVTHGAAVAAGMVAAARLGVRLGVTPAGLADELAGLLAYYKLPTEIPYGPDALYNAALSDKKRRGGVMTLVLIEDWGRAVQRKVPVEEFRALLETLN